jgi:hypothetical protein
MPAPPNQPQPTDLASTPALAELAASLPAVFFNCLLRQLAATLPAADGDPDTIAGNWQAACVMLAQMNPRTALEAAAAVRSVAAHFISMDFYARSMRPGLSDTVRQRLAASGHAASRTAVAVVRNRTAHRPQAAQTGEPPPRPRISLPIQNFSTFQPRDRFGNPVHPGDIEHLTPAQRRAAIAWPRDPALEAVAVAEEEAMIAEQKAIEASGGQATPARIGSGAPG